MIEIYYDLRNFASALPNGLESPQYGYHPISGTGLAWAAATVGITPFGPRPRRASALEIQWRIAMLYNSLTSEAKRLWRSDSYARLDPSEKGAVSFFLGQAQAKLFAHDFFGVDLFVHYDSYLAHHGGSRRTTRPDFIGFNGHNVSIGVEAKGRSNRFEPGLIARAKHQVSSLPTVQGHPTSATYVHVAYFDGDEWCAYLEDPPRQDEGELPTVAPTELTLAYYEPIVDAILSRQPEPARPVDDVSYLRADFEDVDVHLLVRADIAEMVSSDERVSQEVTHRPGSRVDTLYQRVMTLGAGSSDLPTEAEYESGSYLGGDGVAIELGPSWREWLVAD